MLETTQLLPAFPRRLESDHLGQMFATTAAEFPARIAVSTDGGELSYRELDSLTSGVAARLQRMGVGPEVLVGLLTSRSLHMIVGAVGIARSGGAYLPIDPVSGPERIRWILDHSGVEVLVTESDLESAHAGFDGRVVLLDQPGEDAPNLGPTGSPVQGDDLAYVIYTSGSTGKPKGVKVEHRSVARLFRTTHDCFGFDENDVWTMAHSIAFDFSVWEMWGALLYGGHLVVVDHDTARSPTDMLALLHSQSVTVLNQTPTAFRSLISASDELPALRWVILGGEKLEVAMLEPWIARRGDEQPRLVNMYGITEVTVHASFRRIEAADLSQPSISPIGEPLPDLDFLVLDADGETVPREQPGELYIIGSGVARGYLGNAPSNSARFSVSPAGDGRRMYRTGDRVALRGDEYIYLGRTDDQLKIRGYRIEPREIECVLEQHSQVETSIVTAQTYGVGDVRLVAYLVPVAGVEAGEDWCLAVRPEVDRQIESELPPYMRPSAYMAVAELPRTLNGKVDRSRLPEFPTTTDSELRGTPSVSESEIARIWNDMGLEVSDRDDEFFDLGGTSLALVRMFELVNERFDVDLDVGILADEATISVLASAVDEAVQQTKRNE